MSSRPIVSNLPKVEWKPKSSASPETDKGSQGTAFKSRTKRTVAVVNTPYVSLKQQYSTTMANQHKVADKLAKGAEKPEWMQELAKKNRENRTAKQSATAQQTPVETNTQKVKKNQLNKPKVGKAGSADKSNTSHSMATDTAPQWKKDLAERIRQKKTGNQSGTAELDVNNKKPQALAGKPKSGEMVAPVQTGNSTNASLTSAGTTGEAPPPPPPPLMGMASVPKAGKSKPTSISEGLNNLRKAATPPEVAQSQSSDQVALSLDETIKAAHKLRDEKNIPYVTAETLINNGFDVTGDDLDKRLDEQITLLAERYYTEPLADAMRSQILKAIKKSGSSHEMLFLHHVQTTLDRQYQKNGRGKASEYIKQPPRLSSFRDFEALNKCSGYEHYDKQAFIDDYIASLMKPAMETILRPKSGANSSEALGLRTIQERYKDACLGLNCIPVDQTAFAAYFSGAKESTFVDMMKAQSLDPTLITPGEYHDIDTYIGVLKGTFEIRDADDRRIEHAVGLLETRLLDGDERALAMLERLVMAREGHKPVQVQPSQESRLSDGKTASVATPTSPAQSSGGSDADFIRDQIGLFIKGDLKVGDIQRWLQEHDLLTLRYLQANVREFVDKPFSGKMNSEQRRQLMNALTAAINASNKPSSAIDGRYPDAGTVQEG